MENNKKVVLFQGDSITDSARHRYNINDLGLGYAMMSTSFYQANHPKKNIKFINKGISGDRITDLKQRWTKDCIKLNPDVVSIFIGINDCWRRYDSGEITSAEEFKEDYRFILKELKEKTSAKIILIEPFLLPVPEDRKKWREDLDPKINVVRELAREFQTDFVPLDAIFAQAAIAKEPEFWAPDGVHPSPAGHALIAREWLKVFEKIEF